MLGFHRKPYSNLSKLIASNSITYSKEREPDMEGSNLTDSSKEFQFVIQTGMKLLLYLPILHAILKFLFRRLTLISELWGMMSAR